MHQIHESNVYGVAMEDTTISVRYIFPLFTISKRIQLILVPIS